MKSSAAKLSATLQSPTTGARVRLLGVAVAYGLIHWVFVAWVPHQAQTREFFLASGVALASLLLGGPRYALAIFAGAFCALAWSGTALWIAAGSALGASAAALLGSMLVRRDPRCDVRELTMRSLLRIVLLGGLVASGVSAVIGSAGLLLAGVVTADRYGSSVIDWWMGDSLGVLLLTPLMLCWWTTVQLKRPMPSSAWLVEATALFGLSVLACGFIFLEWFHPGAATPLHALFNVLSKAYWMFLFVTLAAVRLGLRGTSALLALIAALGYLGIYRGSGFFAADAVQVRALSFWFFSAVLSLSGLSLAAAMEQKAILTRALRQSEGEAKDELGYIRSALDQHSIVVATDVRGRITSVNEKFCQISGYTREELLGQDHRLVNSGTHSAEFFQDMYRTLARGQLWQAEVCNRAKDGHLYWMQTTIAPFMGADAKPVMYVAIRTDISASKQSQVVLAQARQEAEAANLAKSDFLATMSHELRTPLNGVLGMAQLLLMPALAETERRDYARTILTSGRVLLALLNDILDLSKVEAGKLVLESRVFEPAFVLQETRTLFSGAAQVKNLQLECHWHGPAEQRYRADSYRLRQMIANLVGNAIKFTAVGAISIEATELQRDQESVLLEFSVRDSGIGIAADKIELLFKPFSQADSSTTRKFGGSGLGLSLVSRLAQAMGGEVGVESVAAQGSRFWFRVRVKLVSVEHDSRAAARTPIGGAPAQLQSLPGRVLAVEDNAVNAMVIQTLLKKLGLQVTLVTDGQQALDAIALGQGHEKYDLVLMDVQMPVMDGYTATKLIRQFEAQHGLARMPIVALTANAFEEDRNNCLAAGMDDFLAKPVSVTALRSALQRRVPQGRDAAPSVRATAQAGAGLVVDH